MKQGSNRGFVPVLSVFYPCLIRVLSGVYPKQFQVCPNALAIHHLIDSPELVVLPDRRFGNGFIWPYRDPGLSKR